MIARKRLLPILVAMLMAFAMMPMAAPAYAASGDPAMILGANALAQNVNTSNAQTVWYADKTWRVIGYDGNGAASKSGAATLLAAGNLEQTPFDESSPYSNVYADSILKAKVDAIAGSLSDGEQGAIVKKTLVHGDHNGNDTDCISGDEDIPDVLLWPLSTKEANAVSNDIRIADPEHTDWATSLWWLRSPGNHDAYVALVVGRGDVNRNGRSVSGSYGVRPAFDLNLESVLFISAAESGKSSGAAGTDALKAQSDQTNSGNEWKVTLQSGHEAFAITGCTPVENGVTVDYTDAESGDNEYISAVIKDNDGKIAYYGRIAKVSDAGTSGSVAINTAGKLGDGDTLYVFNEQYNGEKKTDYASALQEVDIPKPVTYTVTFVDGQGNTLKTEEVESGKAATAPEDPSREGYAFDGWDKDFSNITSDLTVTAKWKADITPPTPTEPINIKGANVVLNKTAFTYNAKVQKPTISTIKGLSLKAGTDYTVKWSNADSKKVGAYTVTITGKGNYTGMTKATYRINPKGTSLKTPKKAKKAVTVKWKKQSAKMSSSRISGYQILLATNSKFTKNKKTVTVKGYSKTSKKVTKLKGGKKYYVKIRTYKTVGGTKCYSSWSKVKTVTTKK